MLQAHQFLDSLEIWQKSQLDKASDLMKNQGVFENK